MFKKNWEVKNSRKLKEEVHRTEATNVTKMKTEFYLQLQNQSKWKKRILERLEFFFNMETLPQTGRINSIFTSTYKEWSYVMWVEVCTSAFRAWQNSKNMSLSLSLKEWKYQNRRLTKSFFSLWTIRKFLVTFLHGGKSFPVALYCDVLAFDSSKLRKNIKFWSIFLSYWISVSMR